MLGDVRERSIAIVAVKYYSSVACHEQIRPAIVIEVPHDRTHGPAGITDTRLIRDVSKGSIVIIVVKRASCFFAGKRHIHALRVGKVNIGPSIAVIVNERNASAHRLHNVFLLRTRKMIEFDARRIGDIH